MSLEAFVGIVCFVAIFLIVNAGYFWRRRK
jgi:hypothetical protein